jgi:hypothetical protein
VQATETARWYHEQEMRCTCGGEFDSTPFLELMLFIDGKREVCPSSVRTISDIS